MNGKVGGWVTGLMGIWIFIAGFLNFSPLGNTLNNLIIGLVITIFGLSMVKPKPWQGWITSILGFWLMVAAFIPFFQQSTGNLWNDIISGGIITIFGFSALAGKSV